MAKFDLHQLLNERSKAAAVEREREPRTADGMEQLTLDVYDLIPSQENFYSTQYISDLKQSIAIVGLLQPLLVERDGDKFRVVAGHRRRLACMALVEDGLAQFRRVPCVTRAAEEEGTVKTILDRLALIFANGFREKSDWEKMEETLRTEALIAELRKEVEVEGRTRWITAEFTGITEAQIGRYKSIKNNLCPELITFCGLLCVPGVYGASCKAFQTWPPSSFINSGCSFNSAENRNTINSLLVCAHSSAVMFGFWASFICRSSFVRACPAGLFSVAASASVTRSTNCSKFSAIFITLYLPFF